MSATVDYATKRASAHRLIERFGRVGTLKRRTRSGGTAYNPGSISVADHSCTIVVTDYSQFERQSSLIEAGDRRVYMSADDLAVAPSVADTLTIDGEEHSIVAVAPFSPASVVVFYELQVRR